MTRPVAPVLALFGAGLGAAAQFAKISTLFPLYQAAYPDAGAALGFLLTLISLTGLVLGLVAGMVVARIGFRRVLLWALLGGAVLSAIQSPLLPLPLMLLTRLAEGASHLAIVVVAPTLMAELTDDRMRPLAMTLWGTFFGVAFAVFALIGPPLVAGWGLPGIFLLHAVYMLAMAALLARLLPRDIAAAPAPRLTLPVILRRHVDSYLSPRIAAPALGWLFYTLTFVSLMTVLPLFLAAETRGLFATIIPVAGIVTSLTLGALALRFFPAVGVTIFGFVLACALCLLLRALPGEGWPAILLFAALGFVQGGSFALVPQILQSPADRALANGAMAQMGNFGNLIGTPILLAMTGAMAFDGLILFSVLCYGAGAAVHLALARVRARQGARAAC